MALTDVEILDLPRINDPRGNLSFIENGARCLPFDIARVYWVYDVPGGCVRHGHAFYSTNELIVALSGSFDVVLSDGREQRRIHLSRSYTGVYVPAMTWRELDNFSTNSVAMVLASSLYDELDYIRDFELYKTLIENGD
ncbi:MAG: FdtA/QdtA family cupin domain-containing protein [Muribaculaceae bacterium]|nr:FdtA/QdtA family cupin domain-containing protein [Muribaculaceae bacterium]